ncbi:MAG: DUF2125 domain-containing protein [Hyphomonadaceae bacterium]
MSESTTRRVRRWGLIIPAILFVVLALGWTAYWHILKDQAARRIEAALAHERAAGAEANATIVRAWGFPLELAFDLADVSYAPADGAWRASTQRMRLNVSPTNPQHLIAELPAPLTLAFRGERGTTLTGEGLIVSIRTRGNALAQAGVEGANVRYADPAPDGRSFTAGRLVANLRPDPRTQSAYQFSLDIENFGLARPVRAFEPFGTIIERASARIVLERGAALMQLTRRDPLEAWARDNGSASIESARVQWGPATIEGRGRVGVDAERRFDGRIDVTFEDPAEAIRALSQSESIPRDARRALELFAVGAALSGDDLDTNVAASDGWLSLGGIRVREIAPLY